MAKNLKKTIQASAVDRRQMDHVWTLAWQLGRPVDFEEGWAETSNPFCVPERLLVFAKDSRDRIKEAVRHRHQHHRFVLIIIVRGTSQICVDERIFRLGLGQALLIFPFQFRHHILPRESSVRWVVITFEMARTDSLEFRRNHPWKLAPGFTQILCQMLEMVSSRNSARAKRAPEAQLWLMLLLYQCATQGMRAPLSSPALFTEGQVWLKRIHGFLNRHSDQSFKAKDMAREIGYSRSYIDHQFKKHFKISLGRYLTQMRLKKAMGLLRENMLNISGVAEACGYSSIYAFSRTFSAAMGCSPRDYRIQFKRKNPER